MNRLCRSFVRVLLLLALAIGVSSILFAATWRSREHATALAAEGRHSAPVIVELFTSEGCSSCPPADALLAQYEKQQPIANAQVIALEEHVDYWNELGWVDPFSGREYTERQAEYAAVLKNGNPYTPQIVVDGHTEFVGSHERTAQQAITRAAMDEKSDVSLTLEKAHKSSEQGLQVKVGKLRAAAVGDTTEVWLAVTESGLHSAVTRGENAGHDLDHASIVRLLRKIGNVDQKKDAGFSRSLDISLDSRWKRANLRAVVFLQERKSRRVLGAAAANVGE
jgi:hypothetical protein